MTDKINSILNYALKHDIINLDDVEREMNKQKREFLLTHHKASIWEGKDHRWRSYLPDSSQPSGRRMIVKSSQEKLYEELISYYEKETESRQLASITLRKLYPQWIEYKALRSAPTYMSRLHTDWKTYYLNSDIIDIPIKTLNKLTLDVWCHKLIQQYSMSKNQYYNVTTIIRQALNYAVDLGIIDNNPLSLVKIDGKRVFRKVKKKPDATQIFFKEELELIYPMAWKDFYNRTKIYQLAPLALLFQFQTGLRISELCTVRYEDIETPDYIHIQRMLRRDTNEVVEHTKSDCGDRQVFLTSMAKDIIAKARERQTELGVDNNGYIFSIINNRPLTERSVSDLYRKYCKNAGIIHKSSHKARKNYISSLIQGQVNLNLVREMAGHAEERTTLKNYCYDRSTDSEKMKLIENALN